uniref:Immunoglobulin domain-containing protein n=1 Tax=Anabas testudineus TaxID=64144 RepID=A0AAQ6IF99_ANATE
MCFLVLFLLTGEQVNRFAGEGQFCKDQFCITLTEGQITAETGLCVVIPCSFSTSDAFTSQHIVWYKCEQNKIKCADSDMIFHTNKNKKVQAGFMGRVSLLESDLSKNNCSIIVNDLRESDSGSYQLRVNDHNLNQKTDGFTFSLRANVSVKGMRKTHSDSSSTDRGTSDHTDLHCSWSLLWICS